MRTLALHQLSHHSLWRESRTIFLYNEFLFVEVYYSLRWIKLSIKVLVKWYFWWRSWKNLHLIWNIYVGATRRPYTCCFLNVLPVGWVVLYLNVSVATCTSVWWGKRPLLLGGIRAEASGKLRKYHTVRESHTIESTKSMSDNFVLLNFYSEKHSLTILPQIVVFRLGFLSSFPKDHPFGHACEFV